VYGFLQIVNNSSFLNIFFLKLIWSKIKKILSIEKDQVKITLPWVLRHGFDDYLSTYNGSIMDQLFSSISVLSLSFWLIQK
jgi:hypothetical protein